MMRRVLALAVVGFAAGALCADEPLLTISTPDGYAWNLRLDGPDGGVVWRSSDEAPEHGGEGLFVPLGWWRGAGRYAVTAVSPGGARCSAAVPLAVAELVTMDVTATDGGCAVSAQVVPRVGPLYVAPVKVGDFPPYAPPYVHPTR